MHYGRRQFNFFVGFDHETSKTLYTDLLDGFQLTAYRFRDG